MAHRFSVRVTDSSGYPVRGQAVWANEVGFSGESATEYTDSEGWVEFANDYLADHKTMYVEIWVAGEMHGPYEISNGDSFNVEL
jgi:hypothetical protein